MNTPLDKTEKLAYNTIVAENDEEKDFNSLTDEDLCLLCRAESNQGLCPGFSPADVLAERYIQLVRRTVRPYYLVGGDHDDLLQEGMIGLLKAMREFDPVRSSFLTFASYCIRTRVYDAIRQAQGKNQQVLSMAVPLELFLEEENETELEQYGHNNDPEALVINREEQRQIAAELNAILSGFEKSVLSLYLEGFSFSEMAHRLNRPVKSIDNAVTRIRRKLSPRLH